MDQNELSLERVLKAVLHRKGAFLASFLAAAAVLGAGAAKIPPRYKASVVLTIEPGRFPNDFLRPNVIPDLETRLSSMEKMLESAPIIEELRTRTGLAARDGQHGFDVLALTGISSGDPVDAWRKSFEFEILASQTLPTHRNDEAVVVQMSYKHSDPELAARVVNACAARANEENTRFRRAWVEEVVRFVQKEEERVKSVVHEREDAFNSFKLANADRLPDQEPYVVSRLAQLRVRYEDLKNAERFAESRVEQFTSERGLLVAQIALGVQVAAQNAGTTDTSSPNDLRAERIRLVSDRDTREDELQKLVREFTDRTPQVQIARDRLEATKQRLAEVEQNLANMGIILTEEPAPPSKPGVLDFDGKEPGTMPGGLPKVPVTIPSKDKDSKGKDSKDAKGTKDSSKDSKSSKGSKGSSKDSGLAVPASTEPAATRVVQALSNTPLEEHALEKTLDPFCYRLVVSNPGYGRIRSIDFALKETKEAQKDTARQREEAFTDIRKSEEILAAIPGVRQRLDSLVRSLTESRDDFNRLQNQLDNANKALAVENEGKGEQLRVIDFARPPSRPTGPPQIVFVGIALALALGLAAAACLGLDMKARAKTTPAAPSVTS